MSKINYEVTLKRKFNYPKSVLQKDMEVQDAQGKAVSDMHHMLNEIAHNKHEDFNIAEMFEIDCVENKGFKFKKTDTVEDKITMQEVIDFLANQDLEKKHGVVSVEENPDLFQFIEGDWYLLDSVEGDLQKLKQKYIKLFGNLIRKLQHDVPVTANRRRAPLRTGTRGSGYSFDLGGFTSSRLSSTSPTIIDLGEQSTRSEPRYTWTSFGSSNPTIVSTEQPVPQSFPEDAAEEIL